MKEFEDAGQLGLHNGGDHSSNPGSLPELHPMVVGDRVVLEIKLGSMAYNVCV